MTRKEINEGKECKSAGGNSEHNVTVCLSHVRTTPHSPPVKESIGGNQKSGKNCPGSGPQDSWLGELKRKHK